MRRVVPKRLVPLLQKSGSDYSIIKSVTVEDGYLVITFVTEEGEQSVRIDLSEIFDADDYYTKTWVDANLVTNNALSNTLADYITQNALSVVLDSYATKQELASALADYVTLATDQHNITGSKSFTNRVNLTSAYVTSYLSIPQIAPSVPLSGYTYLWSDSNGNYSELPSGGGAANVYDLTIRRGSVSVGPYNLGDQAADIDLASLFSGYATQSWVNTQIGNIDFSPYALKTQIPTKVSDLTNDTGFITSSALSGYATESWVLNKSYITSSALNGYVNTIEQGDGNYVTGISKDGKKLVISRSTLPTKLSDFTDDVVSGNYLPIHGTADKAFRLSDDTVHTAWGQTFWQNGVPQTVSGDISNAGNITGSGQITIPKAKFSSFLIIPHVAPSGTLESGETYLYSGTGEYAEETGGGVANIYDLTIRKNGTSLGKYNLGEEAADINIPVSWADLTENSTHRFLTDTMISTWNAKYDKPSGGIPKSDLTASVQTSLGKADTALQEHQDLSSYVNAAVYNTMSKEIELKHGNTVVASIDATAFIKDGMVSSVEISNGYLVITFNTDAGQDPIMIALTDIFNPNNYYDKTATDNQISTALTDYVNAISQETGNYVTGITKSGKTLTIHRATFPTTWDWTNIVNTPTNLAGYGITDGVNTVTVSGSGNAVTAASISGHGLMLTKGNTFVDLTSQQTGISGKKIFSSISVTGYLAIPQIAPASPTSGEVYLWADDEGSYAESASGGIGDVYDLTLRSGSTQLGVFQPGVEDKTIDLSPMLNGYATQSWVSANFNNYVLPTASASVLGGVKVGSGLSIDASGVLSFSADLTGYATKSELDIVASGVANNSARITSLEDWQRDWDIDDYVAAWALETSKPSYALSEISGTDDLRLIEALTGSGLLKKTAANTWALDTNSYLVASSLKDLTLQVNGETAGTYNPNTAATIDLPITEFATSEEDDAMFTSRQVPSVAVGDVCKITSVKGKSVVWNQLFQTYPTFAGENGITATLTDGWVVLNGTATADGRVAWLMTNASFANGVNTFISGHIYLFKMCPRNGSTNTFYGRSNNAKFQAVDTSAIYDLGEGVRFSLSNASLSVYISLQFKNGVVFNNVRFRPQVIDLTSMFGSGNEPTTDQLRALYPLDYYDYSPNTLVNNAASGIEMLDAGGNSLGEIATPVTEIVPADKPTVRLNQLVQTSSFKTQTFTGGSFTNNGDGSHTVVISTALSTNILCIKSPVATTNGHKYFLNVVGQSNNYFTWRYNGASNASWPSIIVSSNGNVIYPRLATGMPTGTYKVYFRIIDLTEMYGAGNEPTSTAEVEELIGTDYIPYTTGEDIPNRIFPVGMKSAGSVADEWSGSTTTKRIGVVDLGTLNWRYATTANHERFVVELADAKTVVSNQIANILSSKYVTVSADSVYTHVSDKIIGMSGASNTVAVYDSAYTDVATFKAAMSGVLLYYELATPETYTVDALPDTLVQFDAQGTQRRLPVDTSEEVAAPMVCDFVYGANIGDLLPTVDYKIRHGHVALADEAIKLQTARTIWGQSFDGTANVSGALTEVTDITGTGLITMPNGKFSSSFIIPHIAPSGTLETGEVYFWSDTTGIYSEMPSGSGGDVGDIYPLTIVVNGVQTVYNPAEQRQTLTLSIPTALSSLTDDATHRLVTDTQISAWDAKQAAISDLATIRSNANLGAAAYGWGDHRQAGYLTSYTETDPVFSASAAAGITSGNISAWNGKQDAISDLATIRSNASTAATAVDVQQGYGLGIDSSGHLMLDSHDAADVLGLGSAAFKGYDTAVTSGSANLVTSGAVYTAVSVKYTKPSTGIPKTDLASAVQTSLGKADTALQSVAFSDLTSHPTTLAGYGITDAKIANGVITLGGNSITPLTSFTETDPTVPAWAKAASKPTYTLDEIANGTTRSLANYLPLIGGTLTGNLTGTSATFADGKFTSSLIIPHIAPSVILESEESYLYASATGNFSEEAPDAVGIASVIQTSSSSESGGTNIVTVTLTDGSKSTFGVRNGQQGNSGYSGAAGELEVVNNLTDGGATAALSAEMGKTLDGKIGALKDKNLNKRLFGTRVSGSAPWPGFVVSDYIDIPASHFTSRMYNWGTRPGYGFRYVDSGGNIITLTRNTGTLFNSFVIDYYDIPASAVTIRLPLYNLTEEQIASIFIGSDSDADYLSWPFLAKGTLPAVTSAWYAGDSDEIKAIVDAYPEYKDMTGYPSVRVSPKNLFSLKDVMFYGYNTVSPGYPFYYSGYMPVEAGKKYTLSFKGTFSPQTYYYTSEKVYIERSLYATSTAPATAAFARVALTSYNDVHLLDPSSEVQFEQSEFATSYEPYFIYGTDDISVPLKDKGFAFLGDSFTAGNLWCTTMASILKAKVVYNAAVSGSTWSTNAPDQADRLISSGSTPDYILCFLGVNDANNTMPLGNIVYSNNIAELESSTFTGGVQRALNKLMNAFPSAVIKIGWTPAGQSFTGTLDVSQYINRLKDLSIVYGVQFVETRYCGISPYINADADYYEYGTGGGHPTATGQTRIGEAMARIMVSNQ